MLPDDQLSSLAQRFRQFAQEAAGRSELYAELSEGIAARPSIVRVLENAAASQRRPNLLFAAVHDLLVRGAPHQLREYYPSVGGHRRPDGRTLAVFESFVDRYESEISQRVSSRNTQTNEVGRCAAIWPALSMMQPDRRPAAIVELGASAGLLLHLDRYRYRYGRLRAGPDSSPVEIAPDVVGDAPSSLSVPRIVARIGVDCAPLSITDPDDISWLRACVWPEDVDRLERLDAALAVAATHGDVELVQSDMTMVRKVAGDLPSEWLVCVIHSAAFAYLDAADRSSIENQLDDLGSRRDLYRICFEGSFIEPFAGLDESHETAAPAMGEHFVLGLTKWIDGRRTDKLLARAQPHGDWLQWLASDHPRGRQSNVE